MTEAQIIKAALALSTKAVNLRDRLSSSDITQLFLQERLKQYGYEVFCCLFLDIQNRLMAVEEMFRGTIEAAAVTCVKSSNAPYN